MDIITITVEDSKHTELVMKAIQKGFEKKPRAHELLGNGVTVTLQRGDVIASGSLDEARDQVAQMIKDKYGDKE